MLVIGSYALRLNGVDIYRKPADIDLVGTFDEVQEFIKKNKPKAAYPIAEGRTMFLKMRDDTIVEIEIAWPGSRAEKLLAFVEEQDDTLHLAASRSLSVEDLFKMDVRVATVDLLLLLKESHKYLKNSPHFYKTMADIRYLRTIAEIPEAWLPFLAEREKDTYNYGLPKLNVKNKEFFDSEMTGVHQVYDHDSIHEAVAILSKPAYKYYQPEDSEVMCSKEMFDAQPHRVKLFGVIEEAMVLALERSLIPHPGAKTPEEAFKYALMKVCTSITGGWFREWAWEHHDAAVRAFESMQLKCFTKKFERALELGIVKKKT